MYSEQNNTHIFKSRVQNLHRPVRKMFGFKHLHAYFIPPPTRLPIRSKCNSDRDQPDRFFNLLEPSIQLLTDYLVAYNRSCCRTDFGSFLQQGDHHWRVSAADCPVQRTHSTVIHMLYQSPMIHQELDLRQKKSTKRKETLKNRIIIGQKVMPGLEDLLWTLWEELFWTFQCSSIFNSALRENHRSN